MSAVLAISLWLAGIYLVMVCSADIVKYRRSQLCIAASKLIEKTVLIKQVQYNLELGLGTALRPQRTSVIKGIPRTEKAVVGWLV